jgi:hypothetical protein
MTPLPDRLMCFSRWTGDVPVEIDYDMAHAGCAALLNRTALEA